MLLRRYLGEGEQTVLVTRQHPFALVRASIDMLALLVPLIIAAWGVAGIEVLRGPVGDWLLRGMFCVMVAIVLRLAWRVLAWEFERVVITNEKVIHVSGVLNRRIASTPLAKVSEFTVHQPLLGRVFDYGSLVVDVPGGREQALHGLSFLPNPAGLYRLVSSTARGTKVTPPVAGAQAGAGDAPRVPMPTPVQYVEIEQLADVVRNGPGSDRPAAAGSDPWQPRMLDGDEADHTIQIPRVAPPE